MSWIPFFDPNTPPTRVKDVPALERDGRNAKQVADAVQEAVQIFRGTRGDPLDKALTLRDVGGVAGLNRVMTGTTGTPGDTGPAGPPGAPGAPAPVIVPDLTPPPTPTGLALTSGFANLYIEWTAPVYTQGHGHRKTNIYGRKYAIPGPLPTFTDAVRIGEAFDARTIYAHPTELGTNWAIWLKFESVDGVESSTPAGGANGVRQTIGKIGNTDLGPLIIEAGNLANGAVTATKLAAEAVDLTKFANGIEPVGIVATLPVAAGYAGPKTVLLTADGKLYRYSAGAWTKALDGADITAASIVAGKIAAGAISAAEIAAGAIRAQHLLIAPKSLNMDPSFAAGAVAWNGFVRRLPSANVAVPFACPAAFAAEFSGRDDTGNARIPVRVGEQYRVSCWVAPGTFTGQIGIVVYAWNAAGAAIAISASGPVPSGWVSAEATLTIPAGYIEISFGPWLNQAHGAPQTGWFTDLNIEKVNDASLIVDGAITATKIAANAIAVGTAAIQNGAIVNAMIGNATIDDAKVANLSAAKLTVGDGTIGGNLKSSNYAAGVSGWIVQPNGSAEFSFANIRGTLLAGQIAAGYVTATMIDSRGLSIKDAVGNVILASGSPLDFANVGGGTKPANNATVGATFGVNIGGQINSGNVSTYIANAAIQTAQIDNLAVTTAKIGNAQVDTLQVAGNAITAPAGASLAVDTLIGTGSYTTYASVTLNPASSPVYVSATVLLRLTTTGGANIVQAIIRDGSTGSQLSGTFVCNVQFYTTNDRFTFPISFYDTRTLPGNRVYELAIVATASVAQALSTSTTIFAIGVKR